MGRAPKTLSSNTLNTMKGILSNLDNQFNFENKPIFEDLVNYSPKANEPIHRWFRYREGYSTKLVQSVLENIPAGKLVVDPFCGSGTTLLVAQNLGYPSIGIDANPLSAFIARVKTRNYTEHQLKRFEEICKQIENLTIEDEPFPLPKLSIIEKVFLPEVLHALQILRNFIENHLVRVERDFFFLAWLSILEDVSNVYKEGNGIKYRNRKRTPNGYIEIPLHIWQQSLFPENKFDYIIQIFLKQIRLMIDDVKQAVSENPEATVINGDALSLDEYVLKETAGLVMFSPPYINNFNYFKAFKVELWMGGFINDYDELQEITRSSLRSHVETRLARESDANNWYPEALDELIELIDPKTLWTPRILQAIRGYFYDMRGVIKKIYSALEDGGKCVIVVGNSAYGSTIIPTDSLLAQIANIEGFEVEKIAVARHLTTSSQQKIALEPLRDKLRESVVYLKKNKRNENLISTNGYIFNYKYVNELPKYPATSPSTVYVIRNQGLTDETHIIHKYPGKFIPHIPRWAIEKYLEKKEECVILDPFCGSGTTLVEAHLAGHHAFGIDIDPLARLISKVKTTSIPNHLLEPVINAVIKKVEAQQFSKFRPPLNNLEHWFNSEASNDLGVIREVINEWREDTDIYDFLVICLSSIIRRVSNADNQSLKTYVSGTLKKNPPMVKPLFYKTVKEYAERVIQFSQTFNPKGKTTILDINDARNIEELWRAKKLPFVDLAITSPPYIKTIDYIYNQMAEYFWIGDLFNLESKEKQNKAKQAYIGTEKVQAKEYLQKRKTAIASIDAFIELIYKRSDKHSYIFYKFFDDINRHLAQMSKILNNGGVYVMIVGNSSISDIPIPTHQVLTEVASLNNFKLEMEFAYEIRNRYMRFPRQGRGGIVGLDWIMSYRKEN